MGATAVTATRAAPRSAARRRPAAPTASAGAAPLATDTPRSLGAPRYVPASTRAAGSSSGSSSEAGSASTSATTSSATSAPSSSTTAAPAAATATAPTAVAERPGLWTRLTSAAGDFLAERGWDMVHTLAPGLEPVLRRGPLHYLKDRLGGVFDGLLGGLRALVPTGVVDLLTETFGGLVERAGVIAAGLASGDCQPLFDAVNALKDFATEVASAAWDRITEFLQPVGDFFSDLWAGYGAPAVEWLQQIGGDIWAGIQQLGTDLWNWTEPIRNGVAGAWNWVKTQLFGPDDPSQGDSSGGLVGWVTRKAGEAFDWVKAETRPVWQPIADAAQTIRELLPPAFVTDMGANMRQLSTELTATAGELEEGANGRPVAENREALARALPSVRQVIRAVRTVIVDAGSWLLERLELVAGGVSGFMAGLRANALLGRLAGALEWIERPVLNLVAWGRHGVVALFDWVLQGFDALSPFVERLVRIVEKVIDIASDILRLPMMLAEAAWNLIPCCIRDPIKDFVVTRILSQIPVFGQFFSDPTLWPRVQQVALDILRSLFVDGDIPRAAWMFFQSVLRIFNLPPELVVQILAKAAQAIGDVLSDPIGFLGNLLRAMKEGFGRFFDNIFSHLLGGVATWLFAQVERAGFRAPTDFSLRSIFGFVLEIFGVSVDNVLDRLGRRIGAAAAQRVRQVLEYAEGVWVFVRVLIEEGPAGLWREIQQRLSNLWDTVVNGVVDWVMGRIMARATRWLMGLLDVTGLTPVVNTLIAVYNAIESAVQYMRQMLEIVSTVADGIIDIAQGRTETAAGFVERALADGVPVVVGFLANQFGFASIGESLREIVETGRARVDSAIDGLIDRAIAVGQAFLNLLRRGVAAVRGAATGAVARVREWWRERFSFRGADGEPHNLYFRGEGASGEVIIESIPKSFPQFIADIPQTEANSVQRQQAQDLYDQLRRTQRESPPGSTPDRSVEIVDLANRLARACAELMGPGGSDSSEPPHYSALSDGFGTQVEIPRLTHRHAPGDEPSLTGGRWDTLNRRRRGNGSYYILGHLLNHHLGGPGNTWANITPLTRSANSQMSASFEEEVKRVVNTQRKPVYFRVTAHFEGQPVQSNLVSQLRSPDNPNADDRIIADVIDAERTVPTRLTGEAREIPAGAAPGSPQSRSAAPFATLSVQNELQTQLSEYSVTDTEKTVVYLSHATREELRQLPGVNADLAARIASRAAAPGSFRTRAQFLAETQTPTSVWNGFAASNRFIVRLYRRA